MSYFNILAKLVGEWGDTRGANSKVKKIRQKHNFFRGLKGSNEPKKSKPSKEYQDALRNVYTKFQFFKLNLERSYTRKKFKK